MLRISSFVLLLLTLTLTACKNGHDPCFVNCDVDNEQETDEPTA